MRLVGSHSTSKREKEGKKEWRKGRYNWIPRKFELYRSIINKMTIDKPKTINTFKYHVFAPMGRFQLEIKVN
jgi:hypothetical protein